MNFQSLTEQALKQLDSAGYMLSRYGITEKVNRHNLIALVMTEREHLKGELSRLELKARLQRYRLLQLKTDLSDQADQWISKAPAQLATPLLKAKTRLGH